MNYFEMVGDLFVMILAISTALVIAIPVIFLIAFYSEWLLKKIYK